MGDNKFKCPDCGTDNELPEGSGASSIVEVVCWSCDSVFTVNRHKMSVIS